MILEWKKVKFVMQNDMLNGICHVVNKIFLVASLESRVTQSRGKIIGKTTYNDFISPQHVTCSDYVYDITIESMDMCS